VFAYARRKPVMKSFFRRIALWCIHQYFLLSRGMTFGVRVACFDGEGRVFLVRHTYVPGWHLPGGGVERGETAEQAAHKEIREEGNLEATGPMQLISVHFQNRVRNKDHVMLYRADDFQTGARAPDREIAECGFFALDALPEATTKATRKRLDELAGKSASDPYW
jgi:ADP-ribose pyrophosphatase YjhB (NUDIX family)